MIKCEFVIKNPTDYRVIFCDSYFINYKAEWINCYITGKKRSRVINIHFDAFETLKIFKDEKFIIEIKGYKNEKD